MVPVWKEICTPKALGMCGKWVKVASVLPHGPLRRWDIPHLSPPEVDWTNIKCTRLRLHKPRLHILFGENKGHVWYGKACWVVRSSFFLHFCFQGGNNVWHVFVPRWKLESSKHSVCLFCLSLDHRFVAAFYFLFFFSFNRLFHPGIQCRKWEADFRCDKALLEALYHASTEQRMQANFLMWKKP